MSTLSGPTPINYLGHQLLTTSIKELDIANKVLGERKKAQAIASRHYETITGNQDSPAEDVQEAQTEMYSAKWALTAQESVVTNTVAKVEGFLSDNDKAQLLEGKYFVQVVDEMSFDNGSTLKIWYGLFIKNGHYEVAAASGPTVLRILVGQAVS